MLTKFSINVYILLFVLLIRLSIIFKCGRLERDNFYGCVPDTVLGILLIDNFIKKVKQYFFFQRL